MIIKKKLETKTNNSFSLLLVVFFLVDGILGDEIDSGILFFVRVYTQHTSVTTFVAHSL